MSAGLFVLLGFVRRFGVMNLAAAGIGLVLACLTAVLFGTERVSPVLAAASGAFFVLVVVVSVAAGRARMQLFAETVRVPPLRSPILRPARMRRALPLVAALAFLGMCAVVFKASGRPAGAIVVAVLAGLVLMALVRALLLRPRSYVALCREGLQMVHRGWWWLLSYDNIDEIRLGGGSAGRAVLAIAVSRDDLVKTARAVPRATPPTATADEAGTIREQAAAALARNRSWFQADVVIFDAALPEGARIFYERLRALLAEPRFREELPPAPVFLEA